MPITSCRLWIGDLVEHRPKREHQKTENAEPGGGAGQGRSPTLDGPDGEHDGEGLDHLERSRRGTWRKSQARQVAQVIMADPFQCSGRWRRCQMQTHDQDGREKQDESRMSDALD